MLSKTAKERADAAKAYIEGKYSKLKNEELERKEGKSKTQSHSYSMGHVGDQNGKLEAD